MKFFTDKLNQWKSSFEDLAYSKIFYIYLLFYHLCHIIPQLGLKVCEILSSFYVQIMTLMLKIFYKELSMFLLTDTSRSILVTSVVCCCFCVFFLMQNNIMSFVCNKILSYLIKQYWELNTIAFALASCRALNLIHNSWPKYTHTCRYEASNGANALWHLLCQSDAASLVHRLLLMIILLC